MTPILYHVSNILPYGTPGHNKLNCRWGLYIFFQKLPFTFTKRVTYCSFNIAPLCSQGEMVQKLLCRWWYAMEWPAKEDLKPAPPSFEALEGYPGVFICVEVRAAVGPGTKCRRFGMFKCIVIRYTRYLVYDMICYVNVECPSCCIAGIFWTDF